MKQTQTDASQLQFTVQRRTVIYARVSTDEQAERGTSIEAQIEKSKAYAQSQNMNIVGVFADDYTGTTLDRPELNKVRSMLKSGQADVLICYKTDRLDRSEWGFNLLYMAQELKNLGAELHYSEVGRKVDLFNPQEMLLESIKGWQSGEERNIIVKRLMDGRINRVKQGGVIVAQRPPYGFILVKEDKLFRLEIENDEAEVVRLIFRWYTIGDEDDPPLSLNGIARKLSKMGISSPADTKTRNAGVKKKRGQGQWSRSTIHRMLKSEVYNGTWHFRKTLRINGKLRQNKGEQIPVSVPVIVNQRTWEMAQSKLTQNKERWSRRNKHNYLVANRVTCGCCEYKMAGSSGFTRKDGSTSLYYRCPTNTNPDTIRECDLPNFPADKVDAVIWNWIRGFFEDEALLESAINRYLERSEEEVAPLKEKLSGINTLIEEKENELAQARRDYRAFKDSNAERTKIALLAEIEQLEGFLDDLESRREIAKGKLAKVALSETDIEAIRAYAVEVKQGLDIAHASFEERRWLIEKLDVKATLSFEGGQKVAYVECRLGDESERLNVNLKDDSLLSHTSYGILIRVLFIRVLVVG